VPRQTILPPLSTPPKGYTWEISRIQGNRGGRFGEKGFSYTILLKQGKSVVIDQRFFIPTSEEGSTESVILKNEAAIRKLLKP
jgi:hypothetical protein